MLMAPMLPSFCGMRSCVKRQSFIPTVHSTFTTADEIHLSNGKFTISLSLSSFPKEGTIPSL